MDTSVLLCPINDTMITPLSVIQSEGNGQWPNSPMTMRTISSIKPIVRLTHLLISPFGYMDSIGTRGYNGIEIQGIKIAPEQLARTGTILPEHWETLFSLESGTNHRAISPCIQLHILTLDSGLIHRRLSDHSLCCGQRDGRFFLLEFRMNEFLRKATRLLNSLNYTTSHLECQHSLNSFSYRLDSAEQEVARW